MKKLSDFLVKQCEEHPLILLSFMMVITSVFVYCRFLFGDKAFVYVDVGSDTKDVYYPFFIMLIRKITNGDFSMWDSTYGTGCNVLSRQADVGNIFTWLACIFGENNLKDELVYVQLIKIFLCGYLCYLYLCNFKFANMTKIIVAYIYAFNGYMILWGQHYFFGSACVYVIMLLCTIEKAMHDKKGYLYTALAVAVLLCSSYYLGFMILLTAGAYTIFRLLHMYSWKERKSALKKIAGLTISVLIGGCMASFLFLPSVYFVMNVSSRLNSDSGIFERIVSYASQMHTLQTYKSTLLRLYSNSLEGTTNYTGGWNYYEAPQLYFTSYNVMILLLFFTEIFLDKKRTKKVKILNIVETFISGMFLFLPVGALVMNGFSGITFRYTYIFLPLFGLCYAEIIEKILCRKLSGKKAQIILCGMLSFLFLFIALIGYENYTVINILKLLYLFFILLFIVVIYTYVYNKKIYGNMLIVCIVGLIVANVMADSFISTNYRGCVDTKSYQVNGDANVEAAIQYLHEKDPSYYRIEKNFIDVSLCNDSMLEGYRGISAYNSVMNHNVAEFADEIWPELWTGDLGCILGFLNAYTDVNKATLMGIKYILTKEMITDVPEYVYIDTIGDVYIYQNTCVQSFGQFYNRTMNQDDFIKLPMEERNEIINNNVLVLKDIDTKKTSMQNSISESNIDIQDNKNSGKIEGTVDTEGDGWLFMPIPFEKGWKAYVDGKETKVWQGNIGFSAIFLDAGKHKIMFRYSTPMLKEGIAGSFLGLLLLIVWCIVLYNDEAKNIIQKQSK